MCRQLAEAAIAEGVAESCTRNLPFVALASVGLGEGRPNEAVAVLADARADAAVLGLGPFEMANLLGVEAQCRAFAGDDGALAMARQAVEASRAIGNPSQLGITLFSYGLAARRLEPDGASTAFEESIALTRRGSSDVVLAPSLIYLAELEAQRGEKVVALTHARDALRHARVCGDRPGLLGSLAVLAELLAQAGHAVLAVRCDAIITVASWQILTGTALERHEDILEPARTEAGPEALAGAAARAASGEFEDLAAEIIAELDALIAAEVAAGAGEEERPAASP